ncbi:MAG TPA: DUF6789 family protein [Puia sp.]
MLTKIQQSVIIGIAATGVMTLLMVLGSAMGMPKMSPPNMLAAMMRLPVTAGWVMHFLIGILFAAGYVFLFNNWLKKIVNRMARGVVYGIVVFIVAQIAFPILGAIFGEANMPQPGGSMALLMIGSVLGHIIYGITVALLLRSNGWDIHPSSV